jgi:hypothetical protein
MTNGISEIAALIDSSSVAAPQPVRVPAKIRPSRCRRRLVNQGWSQRWSLAPCLLHAHLVGIAGLAHELGKRRMWRPDRHASCRPVFYVLREYGEKTTWPTSHRTGSGDGSAPAAGTQIENRHVGKPPER